MPEVTVRAIVLRRREAGEADRRLTLLTDTLGKVDAMAKGARKPSSRLAGVSDPLCVSTMTLADGKRLRYVVQAQPEQAFRGLRTDYEKLTQAIALAELYAAVVPWQEEVPDALDLLFRSLKEIESHEKPSVAFLWAQIRLLTWSGFMPQFDVCVSTGDKIEVDRPWVSPQAGGLLSEAAALQYTDRYRVRFEVLVALFRLVERESPPAQVGFVEECLTALLPFWRNIAESQLPALESALQGLARG